MKITKELIEKAQIEINNKFKNVFFVENIKSLCDAGKHIYNLKSEFEKENARRYFINKFEWY